MNWISLSFLAMFSFSLMSFLIVSLTRKGVPVNFVLMFTALGVSLFFGFITLKFQNFPAKFDLSTFVIIGLIILSSVIGNWAQFTATNSAPNPGLVIALVAADAGLLTILSALFLKSKMNLFQTAGLIAIIIGVAAISFGSNTRTNSTSNFESLSAFWKSVIDNLRCIIAL